MKENKKIKTIILIIITFLSLQFESINIARADDDPPPGESVFNNSSGETIILKIYPVSMVFNGLEKYDLVAQNQSTTGGYKWNYISGSNHNGYDYEIINGALIGFNHDRDGNIGEEFASVGYGRYKVEIFENVNSQWILSDTIWIEWDYNFYPFTNDVHVYITGVNNSPKFTSFQWTGGPEQEIPSDRLIKSWDIGPYPNQKRQKNLGNFIYDGSNFMPYPQDSRRDCNLPAYPDQRHCFNSSIGAILTLFLSIRTDVSTKETFIHDPYHACDPWYDYYSKNIVILPAGSNPNYEPNAILEIYAGKTLTLNQYSDWTNAVTLTVKGANIIDNAGELRFRYGSELRVKPFSTLHLEKKSLVNFINTTGQSKPKITLENGSQLCNEGACFTGQGDLIINRGVAYCILTPSNDYIFKDSASLVLNDSADLVIPDSSTVTFEGNSTKFVLKPNSSIKFGSNSKLILKNGARLIASNATFTSLSPGQLWDGIYLEDVAQDSILWCTIENASNGITIRDRYTAGAAPFSAEISGCTFSNKTTTKLNNGLYASNSTNILFRNNNFTSSQIVNGFSRGVVMEYCPGGSLLIIDNVINNSETGVSILQSSPYIARNSITGQQGVEYGIYLDNSNGTVEYNIVNNFQYSLYGLYSSPYLLKNTLSNASTRNIELNSSSIPVMRPLASGSTLYWLGGDNRLEGNPSNGGVGFSTEAFPEMDSGWNSVTLSSASNYMDGTVPPMLGGTFYTRLNYWGEDPPDSNKFIIQDGTIDYDPWTGGEPPPGTDGYQLNDIGFGLYDTVFTKSIGQNPSEDLFIQAYNKERTGKYNESITLYKQVITQYRTSSYAPISLTRIFNCAEKKRSSIGEYTLFESYFRLINTNNIYSRQLREIAEDYVIRAKVRQGRLNDAIADYNQMYQLNQNTPKGLHALLNKQSLERIRDNSYGQQSSNSIMFYQPDNNQTQSSTPKEFRLYQNYPNPFNAKSRIKYQIAKTTDVVLQVFDASGKHVRTLINGEMQPGVYEAEFDGTELASGFFYTGLRPVRFLKQRKWL